jgi:hypothetical protein
MERVKSFHIKAEPTSRTKKDLSALVDGTVNAWLAKVGGAAKNIRLSHSANTTLAYPEAFVIVTYEVKDEEAAREIDKQEEAQTPHADAGDGDADAEDKSSGRRRGKR